MSFPSGFLVRSMTVKADLITGHLLRDNDKNGCIPFFYSLLIC